MSRKARATERALTSHVGHHTLRNVTLTDGASQLRGACRMRGIPSEVPHPALRRVKLPLHALPGLPGSPLSPGTTPRLPPPTPRGWSRSPKRRGHEPRADGPVRPRRTPPTSSPRPASPSSRPAPPSHMHHQMRPKDVSPGSPPRCIGTPALDEQAGHLAKSAASNPQRPLLTHTAASDSDQHPHYPCRSQNPAP